MSWQKYNTQVFGVLLVLGWLALPARAQVEVGDNTSMTLSGNIGFGYTGDYGNTSISDHSLSVNGDATLNGYFYSPKFLSFYAVPMYNRSQANSGSGSLTNSTSVSAGASIFSGSHFPGSVSFTDSLDGSSTFGLPGIEGFSTHGNSRGFGLGWSELLPNLPPVTVQFSQTSSTSSLFGSDGTDHVGSRNFGVFSNYRIDGWFMNAHFNDISTHTSLPSFFTEGEIIEGDTNSKAFSFNTNHKLPLTGNFSFNYGWSDFSGGDNGLTTTGSNQSLSANASFVPTKRLSTSFMATYDSNLSGQVEQQLLAAGSIAPQVDLGAGSHSESFSNFDNLAITSNLSAAFSFGRIQQEVYGESLGATHWSAVVNYRFRKPLLGTFLVYGGVNDVTSDAVHQGTGLIAGINFNRRMAGFDVSGNFGYAQNVQTVLATQVTSDYSYLANARRHITRRLLWYGNFNGFRTGLGRLPGEGSHSEGAGTNLSYKASYNLGASYSKVSGTALLTATGLVTAPGAITPILTGNDYLLSNGTSFSFTVTANPLRRMVLSGAYTKATSDTFGTTNTLSSSKVITAFTSYQFRKMSITGGYTNLEQNIGASGLPQANYSSFFIGIQRWFRAF